MDAEAKSMSPQDLYHSMRRFIDDNQHSRSVDHRWLSKHIGESILEDVAEVGNGKLPPITREKVNAFRAKEIAAEIERKRREMDVLERDLKTLTTKAA